MAYLSFQSEFYCEKLTGSSVLLAGSFRCSAARRSAPCCPQVSNDQFTRWRANVSGTGAIRNKMPELIMKGNAKGLLPSEILSPRAVKDTASVAQQAINLAHDVFVLHDKDESGSLDAEEIASVVLTVLQQMDSDIPPGMEEVTCARLHFFLR